MRIPDEAADRTHRHPRGEFAHIELRQNDRPRFP